MMTMTEKNTSKCPVPPITDPLGLGTVTQPSPELFIWSEDKVGIPRQLIRQLHRYDMSFPTGSYAGKMFLQNDLLWWIEVDPKNPASLRYNSLKYEEIGEYDPNPHLEPCPLCHGEAYCGFEAKSAGDRVKFHITCAECDLTFGNLYKIGLETSIKNSKLVIDLWNKRTPKPVKEV